MLAGDKRRSSRRAALLAVAVGETHAFLCDAVDVGRAVAHQPVAVTAQIGDADIVAPDDDDIGLSCSGRFSHLGLPWLSNVSQRPSGNFDVWHIDLPGGF